MFGEGLLTVGIGDSVLPVSVCGRASVGEQLIDRAWFYHQSKHQ